MSTPTSKTKLSSPEKRLFAFSLIMSLWQLVVRWFCLLGVLQPHNWMPAANLARWGWGIVNFFLILFFLCWMAGLLFAAQSREDVAKLRHPTYWNKYLGWFFALVALVSLVIGRLDAALLSSYLASAIEAVQKMRTGPEKENGETFHQMWFKSSFKLLALGLLIATLHLRSLPLAMALFAVDMTPWLADLPGSKERLVRSYAEAVNKPNAKAAHRQTKQA